MDHRRILITGASGLLGHAIADRLTKETEVVRLGHRQVGAEERSLDLTEPGALEELGREDWDAVVHCAAYRSPDYCEMHREAAWELNAMVPARLAALARRRGARMLHISTDYVFPGTHPPYREDDPCQPVNYYGETKVAAERGVAAADPGAVILRIGALYATPAGVAGSPMLEEAVRAVFAPRPVELDNRIMRYPLFVEDVAEVVRFFLERDEEAGVVHVGAQMGVTRYGWACLVARFLEAETDALRPSSRDLSRSAVRPVDVRLVVDRLCSLGAPVPRDGDKVLPFVLDRSRDWVRQIAEGARLD